MGTTYDPTTDCFICRKHRGEISIPGGAIYEDELVYAGHIALQPDTNTVYPGWLIAELKRHAPGLADQTDEEAQALGLLIARLSRALKASEGAEHVYLFVFGDGVPHCICISYRATLARRTSIGRPDSMSGPKVHAAMLRISQLCASAYACF